MVQVAASMLWGNECFNRSPEDPLSKSRVNARLRTANNNAESRPSISIKLGVISVDLTANTVSFSDSLSKMGQLSLTTSKNVSRSLGLITTASTAMATAVIGSLTAIISKTEDYAFSISKMAEATGTTNEMFSKLAYSAKLAGVPVDLMKTSLERLGKTAGAAQSGQKESIAAYGALGISVKDLQGPLKDSGSLLIAVSKSLEKFGDSTNKTALEQHLLGRSGAEMAPMLRQMSTSFDTASRNATLFGVVIGDKAAAQAEKLHQSMTELESVALGFSLRLLSGVAPALESASGKIMQFVKSVEGMNTLDKIASDVSASVTGVGNAFEFMANHGTAAKRMLEGVAALQVGTILLPLVSGAVKAGTGLDSIGLSAVKMVGKLSGVSAVLPILQSATDAIRLQSFMIAGIAAEENVWAGATYGVATAWKSLTSAMVNNPGVVALGLLAGGLYAFRYAMDADIATSAKFGDAAVTWHDEWKAAIDNTTDSLKSMKTILLSFSLDDIHKAMKDYKSIPNFGQRVHQQANDRASLSRFTGAADLNPNAALPKIDAPALPKEGTERIDIVAKKLLELRDAALASAQSLRDAGKGSDFERADESAKEAKKTIDELNLSLAVHGKHLTTQQEAQIKADTATRINNLSQAKYRDELQKATNGLLGQADAQNYLTNAIGRGADAVRDATMASNASRRDAGQSEEWKRNNAVARAKNDLAFGANKDADNRGTDRSALVNVQNLIDAQLKLNRAVFQGKAVRDQLALADEQNAIKRDFQTRGDTDTVALNQQLDAAQKLFDLKQREADLSRAASMDPAKVYRDQVDALEAAAVAARDAGDAIGEMQLRAAKKDMWDEYLASVDKTTLAVGSASQGVAVFFEQMGRETKSAAQDVHDILGGAFESLNSTIEKVAETQKRTWNEFTRSVKADFADMFRGIAGSLAKLGIQKVEQGIAGAAMGALGKGPVTPGSILGSLTGQKGADPTVSAIGTSNNYLRDILFTLQTVGVGKAFSNGADSLSSLIPPTNLSGAPSMGGGISSLFSAFTSVAGGYAGGRAVGGDVMAGMTYDVGEMGREKFTPTQNGKIIPNKSLGGGSPTLHIDARGANDPAQTEAAIHRAMSVYGPAIAQGAIRAQAEKQFRSPLSRR